MTNCIYCNKGLRPDWAEQRDHIRVCPENPINNVSPELADLVFAGSITMQHALELHEEREARKAA